MNKQTFKKHSSDIRANRPASRPAETERKLVQSILNRGRNDYLAERLIAKAKHVGSPYWYLVDTAPERIVRRLGVA